MEKLAPYLDKELNIVVTGNLGKGGFGYVMKGYRKDLAGSQIQRAFKIIPQKEEILNVHLNKSLREAFNVTSNPHPNICKVYRAQFFEVKAKENSDVHVCIEMELYENGPLTKYLPLNEIMVRKVFYQICSALHYMNTNSGFIHRDIKPQNILVKFINKETNHIEVVLSDFGLAKQEVASNNTTNFGASFGTREYMAPELTSRISGKPSVLTDIYALGISVIRMFLETECISLSAELSKNKPIESLLETYQVPISKELKTMICYMLNKDSRKRKGYEFYLEELQRYFTSQDSLNKEKLAKIILVLDPKTPTTEIVNVLENICDVNDYHDARCLGLLYFKIGKIEQAEKLLESIQYDEEVIIVKSWIKLFKGEDPKLYLEGIKNYEAIDEALFVINQWNIRSDQPITNWCKSNIFNRITKAYLQQREDDLLIAGSPLELTVEETIITLEELIFELQGSPKLLRIRAYVYFLLCLTYHYDGNKEQADFIKNKVLDLFPGMFDESLIG